ncbi:hypothetical protein [Rhodococcus sp. BP22]|uniref:hypothetical protein n=1 Tax=Rhodococcus sp. BP22 TaxID=2758566 RepID=UPI001644DC39|nr:hypothetical protein [Rhodococcus sp. BP22]
MLGILIGIAVWLVVALAVAIVLGRVARRADSEELGSTLHWDTADVDESVPHD